MQHNSPVDQLKVDETAVPTQGGNYVLIANINIPHRLLLAESNPREIFRRAEEFIRREFEDVDNIQYQFSAVLELRHRTTGAIRQFHGSFSPAGNQLTAITQFRQFGGDFIDYAAERLHPDYIYTRMSFFGEDTEWTLQRVRSGIINVQAVVTPHHDAITRRGLAQPASQRRSRVHRTFHLP
jgi:hypothetical protein